MSTQLLFAECDTEGKKSARLARTARPRVSLKKRAVKAYRKIEKMMMNRLEWLFCDEHRRSLQRRYDLTDSELLDLLDTLQKMFFPGRYIDPRLIEEGLVPPIYKKVKPGNLLLMSAGVVGRDKIPLLPYDVAGENWRRKVVKQVAISRIAAADASHEARPAGGREEVGAVYVRHTYPTAAE